MEGWISLTTTNEQHPPGWCNGSYIVAHQRQRESQSVFVWM